MRVLGIDVGRRRVGLAISDPTGTLARPLQTLTVDSVNGVDLVLREIRQLTADEEGLAAVVVGLPVSLDGRANEQTAYVQSFIDRLRAGTTVPVETADERLTSHEAESRLALNERSWRRRKERLDAAAAAIILQDYLDR